MGKYVKIESSAWEEIKTKLAENGYVWTDYDNSLRRDPLFPGIKIPAASDKVWSDKEAADRADRAEASGREKGAAEFAGLVIDSLGIKGYEDTEEEYEYLDYDPVELKDAQDRYYRSLNRSAYGSSYSWITSQYYKPEKTLKKIGTRKVSGVSRFVSDVRAAVKHARSADAASRLKKGLGR